MLSCLHCCVLGRRENSWGRRCYTEETSKVTKSSSKWGAKLDPHAHNNVHISATPEESAGDVERGANGAKKWYCRGWKCHQFINLHVLWSLTGLWWETLLILFHEFKYFCQQPENTTYKKRLLNGVYKSKANLNILESLWNNHECVNTFHNMFLSEKKCETWGVLISQGWNWILNPKLIWLKGYRSQGIQLKGDLKTP